MPQTIEHVHVTVTNSPADGSKREDFDWPNCQVRAKSPGWLSVQCRGEDTFSDHPERHDWSQGYQLIDESGQVAGDLKDVLQGAGDRGERVQFIVVAEIKQP